MTPYEYHSLQIIQFTAVVLPIAVIFLVMLNILLFRKLWRLEETVMRSLWLFEGLGNLDKTMKKTKDNFESGVIDKLGSISVDNDSVSTSE